jgi:hypothetical protein
MIAKVETPAVLKSAFVSYGRVDCIGEMWHGGGQFFENGADS